MFFARFLAIFLILASVARAQTGTSPLTGKIIHLYNPFRPDTAYIDLSGMGYALIPEADGWDKFEFTSVPGGIPEWLRDFNFRTSNYSQRMGKDWYGNSGNFGAGDFGVTTEIWIIIDPSGPFPEIKTVTYNKIDPATLTEGENSYFTNQGVPVASEKKTVYCLDIIFKGGIQSNKAQLS